MRVSPVTASALTLPERIYGTRVVVVSKNICTVPTQGPASCTVLYSHLFLDPNAAEIAEVIALADMVMEQDRRIVEAVQRNLASGSYAVGRLSPRHENGVLQFQDLVRAASG